MINQSINADCCYLGGNWKSEFYFYENSNIVQFHFYDMNARVPFGIITNIARVTKKSSDCQISCLIKKLNDSYDNIKHMKEEKIV